MKDDSITLELLSRTAIEIQKLPKYDKRSLKSLAEVAYEFLTDCQKVLRTHEIGSVTYSEAVRLITGYSRVREPQLKLFEKFYLVTHPRYSEQETFGPEIEQDLARLKSADSVPLEKCSLLASKFTAWQHERRRRIARANVKKKK